jgi:hypothetical protein
LNSGEICPGNKSLEPFVGTILTLEEKNFINEFILVEITKDNFLFKYEK